MRVRKTRRFLRELAAQTHWFEQNRSARHAAAFYRAAMRAARSLAPMPESRPICRESDDLPNGPYREHYFGVGTSKTHRLVFRVTAAAVEVVAVRSLRQRDLAGGDM